MWGTQLTVGTATPGQVNPGFIFFLNECSFVVSGEITSEELQQRLERAKEQLASQPGSDSAASDGGSVACTAAGGHDLPLRH